MITIDIEDMAASLSAAENELNTLNHTIDEEKKYKAAFICEEILTNLARHADFEGRYPEVTLSYDFEAPDSLIMYFKDNSKSFNLLEFSDPTLSDDLDNIEAGGLGIFLTKQYARTLQYKYEKNHNILKVVL